MGEACVDCVCHTAIRLTDPVSQPLFVFSNDFNTAVRASAVDDDVFQIWVSLKEDRTNTFFDKFTLVEQRSVDADLGPRPALRGRPAGQRGSFLRPRPAGFTCWRRRQFL